MHGDSGRSLIEMLGVMAIAGIMAVGAVKMYQTVRTRQQRFVAEQELRGLAENARLIYAGRRNYAGISKGYLIKAGALRADRIGGRDFRLQSAEDGKTFSVIFDNVDFGDCAYYASKRFDWTEGAAVNGMAASPAAFCARDATNKLEFIIR